MDRLTAVLLPGIDGTGKMFGPLIEQLPAWISPQVVSYPTQNVLTYAQLTEYVLARLPKQNPFIIIAESFAGPLALMVARQRPPGLAALVLCCTFLTNPRPWLSRLARWVLSDWLLGIRPHRWMAKLFVTGFAVPDEVLEHALTVHTMVTPRVLRHRLYAVFDVDVRDIYQSLSLPMLHVYGRHDHLILRYSTREIQHLRPDVHSVAVDGPHYLLQLKPRECAKDIIPFVAQAVSATVSGAQHREQDDGE